MKGLLQVEGGDAVLPFVRMFYGAPSQYLWEDAGGMVHHIPQGEGDEQGDALMPLLFAVGQHRALEVASGQLRAGERLFAFHDDIYMVTMPERVGAVYSVVEEQLCPCQNQDSRRQDQGVEPSWREAPNLRRPGSHRANGESQSCLERVRHPHGAAGDQSVGDAIGS